MLNYVVRRLLIGLITLTMITVMIYGLIRNMPGTPLTSDPLMMDPSKKISDAEIKRLEKNYGLDKPVHIAYFQWIGNLARLDLGRSFKEQQPVLNVIGDRMGATLLLSTTSLLLAYLLAVPMGLFATVRSGRLDERIMTTLLYMLYSVPSFVAGLLLLVLFYQKLQGTPFQLPLGGIVSDNYDSLSAGGKLWDVLKHMLLPVTCATYGSLAYYSRFVKSNMEEVIRQDYIRTARAKGVPPVCIIIHHAFRNTMIPFVTLMGLTLPGLISGFVILESVFTWQGMGSLFIESISNRDYPVIMGLTLMFSIMTLVGQLLADVLYAVADPRVAYH
jgi:peptide/nickel transport system permease protein